MPRPLGKYCRHKGNKNKREDSSPFFTSLLLHNVAALRNVDTVEELTDILVLHKHALLHVGGWKR